MARERERNARTQLDVGFFFVSLTPSTYKSTRGAHTASFVEPDAENA